MRRASPRVALLDADGQTVRMIESISDGTFYGMGVRLGRYTLAETTAAHAWLGAVGNPRRRDLTAGSAASGPELRLRRAMPAAP